MYNLIKLAFKVSDMANKASSDYLMSLCHSAYFHYIDDLVLIFAIVKNEVNLDVVSQYPVIEFDFEKVKDIYATAQDNVDILNGIKTFSSGDII